MKKYILCSVIALGSLSCTDSFLEEKMVSTITQDYFETEQGLEQLIVGTYDALRVTKQYEQGPPMIEEVTGMKHILISPAQQIAYMPVGNTIRYTATIRGGRKLKTGEAVFRVYTTESNGAVSQTHEFSLPTQKRKK